MSEAAKNDSQVDAPKTLEDIEKVLMQAFVEAVEVKKHIAKGADHYNSKDGWWSDALKFNEGLIQASESMAKIADSIVRIKQEIRARDHIKPGGITRKRDK